MVDILLSCLSFKEYTGSEIYFYEIATALHKAGHHVHLFSPIQGSPLTDKVRNVFFKDRYSVDNMEYDIVIFSHGNVIWDYIKNVKAKKFINVVHSEVIELEEPLINSKVNLYVGIRPSIVEFIKNKITNGEVKLIYNPFDFDRFNSKKCKKNNKKDKTVLFPGSLDYLRYKPLKYLLDLAEKQNFKVIHVGRSDYPIVHPNFITYEPTWKVEKYYKKCDIVSGIFLGRTSIEGLLCGKKILQFDVDNKGTIKQVYWHTEDNLQKFNKHTIAKQLLCE
tara:strand:+ start:1449 stop:2282 length:834 start_codon:yes stop_codon:yes gene_type:complete